MRYDKTKSQTGFAATDFRGTDKIPYFNLESTVPENTVSRRKRENAKPRSGVVSSSDALVLGGIALAGGAAYALSGGI